MLPAVAEPFYWSDESWGAALRCRALEPFPHLFTTRQLSLSSDADWQRVAAVLGASHVAVLTQVHGNAVAIVRDDWHPPDRRPEADVLVSDNPRVALAARAADCVPLLLGDPRTGAVAAVHAGWRGTAAGAARSAVEAMHSQFGTQPADLVAAIGPSIGPCCYEVGSELVDAFAAAGHARHLIDRWFLARPAPRGTVVRPRLRLDVVAANRDQLILAGVQERNVHIAALCTAMHLDYLTSFRAEKEKAGRLAGIIRALRVG